MISLIRRQRALTPCPVQAKQSACFFSTALIKPDDDSTSTNTELQDVIELSGKAIATSGNYRNYYIKDGRKIAHTINPKTGYPAQQDILSSTVIAPTCAEADAFATAFMVLGTKAANRVLEKQPQLETYFITNDK